MIFLFDFFFFSISVAFSFSSFNIFLERQTQNDIAYNINKIKHESDYTRHGLWFTNTERKLFPVFLRIIFVVAVFVIYNIPPGVLHHVSCFLSCPIINGIAMQIYFYFCLRCLCSCRTKSLADPNHSECEMNKK